MTPWWREDGGELASLGRCWRTFALLALVLLGGLVLTGWDRAIDPPHLEGRTVAGSISRHARAPAQEGLHRRLYLPSLDRGSRRLAVPIGQFGGTLGPRIWHGSTLYAVVGDRIEVHRVVAGQSLEPVADLRLPGRRIVELTVLDDRVFARYRFLQGQTAGTPERQGLAILTISSDGRLDVRLEHRLPSAFAWWTLVPIEADLAVATAFAVEPTSGRPGPEVLVLLALDRSGEIEILDRLELPDGRFGASRIVATGDGVTMLRSSLPCITRVCQPESALLTVDILDRRRFGRHSIIDDLGSAEDLVVDGPMRYVLIQDRTAEPGRLLGFDLDAQAQLRRLGAWPLPSQMASLRSIGMLAPGLLGAIAEGSRLVTLSIDPTAGLGPPFAIDLAQPAGGSPRLVTDALSAVTWILGDAFLVRVDQAGPESIRLGQRLSFEVERLHPDLALPERSLVWQQSLYTLSDRGIDRIDLSSPDDRLRRRRLPGLAISGGGGSIAASERQLFVTHAIESAEAPQTEILVLDAPDSTHQPPSLRGRIVLPPGHLSRVRISQGSLLSIEYAPKVSQPAGLRIFELSEDLPRQRAYLIGDIVDAILVGERVQVLHETGIQDRRLVLESFDLRDPSAPRSLGPAVELHRFSAAGARETLPSLSRLAEADGALYVSLSTTWPATVLRFDMASDRLEPRDPPDLGGACRAGWSLSLTTIDRGQAICRQAGLIDAWQLDRDRAAVFMRRYRPTWLDTSQTPDAEAGVEGFWVDADYLYGLSLAGITVYSR